MSRPAINKSSLAHQRKQLRLFKRFLPSLDLKRQQLLTEQKTAREELAETEGEAQRLARSLTGLMEPLGAYDIDLSGLVTIDSIVIEEENFVGAKLPVAREVKFKTAPWSKLAKPYWVDFLVEYLQQVCTQRVHLQVQRERVARLNQQVRRITQRVNLFEKVLIPRTQSHIKRIGIALSDQERSSVVRSKLAKRGAGQAGASKFESRELSGTVPEPDTAGRRPVAGTPEEIKNKLAQRQAGSAGSSAKRPENEQHGCFPRRDEHDR